MQEEQQKRPFDYLFEKFMSLFDGKKALDRAKAISDFIGIVTRVALIETVDAYIKIRPSHGDGFSQLLGYAHWILSAFYLIMMFNIFIILFSFAKSIFAPAPMRMDFQTFMPVFMGATMLLLPVVLFVTEGSKMANELVSSKGVTPEGQSIDHPVK